ncbi:MAG TPA: ABC transporter permease [Armatimonadota bacterium]
MPNAGAQVQEQVRLFALREELPRRVVMALRLLSVLVVLFVWWLVTARRWVNPSALPSPAKVLAGSVELWHRDLAGMVFASLWRIGQAFLLSAVIAIPLGLLMGSFSFLGSLLDPFTGPMRYMPITAFIPLLIVNWGLGETMKVAFLFLGIFFYLLPLVAESARSVPEEMIQTAQTLGAGRLQTLMTILVPASLPSIFESLRVMNGIGWTYVVLAEMIATSEGSGGLGYMMNQAQRRDRMDWIFAGIVMIGVIALVSDLLITRFNRWLFSWKKA